MTILACPGWLIMVGVSKRQTMTNGHEPHHKSHEYLLLIAIICCINCSDVRHHEGNRDTSEPPGFSMAKSPMRRWIDPVSGCSCPRACWRRREMTSTCGMSKRLPEISGKNGKIVRECLTVDLVWICSKKGWINSFSHTFSHFWGKDKRRWVNCLGLAPGIPSVAPGPKARSKSLGAAKERWLDMTRHWKLRQFMAVPKKSCGFSGGKLLWVFLEVESGRTKTIKSGEFVLQTTLLFSDSESMAGSFQPQKCSCNLISGIFQHPHCMVPNMCRSLWTPYIHRGFWVVFNNLL